MSSYYDDDDDIDIRVLRGRQHHDPHRRPAHHRAPPIYPPRPIRRATTLPVRFEDEQEIERGRRHASRRDSRPSDRSRGWTTRESTSDSDESDKSEEINSRRERRVLSRSISPLRYGSRSRERLRSISPYGPDRHRQDLRRLREDREHIAGSVRDLERERELRFVVADDCLEREGYSFLLEKHTKNFWSRDSTLGSVSDTSEPEIIPVQAGMPQVGNVLRVQSSKYTGDGSLGGLQSAQLTVMDGDPGSRKAAQPIFRWIIPNLTHSQHSGISKILTGVRRTCDKPMQARSGTKVRFMVPGVLREPLLKDPCDRSSTSGSVTWLCLPYFCLQKYSGSITGLPASSHPMKTLLQARFSLMRKERDMQQAVCHLPGTPQDHCFHIAQIWCLVLDDDLLITCAGAPIPSLTGKSISLSPAPKYPQHSQMQQSRSHRLTVSCDGLLWSFPLDECRTWFAFVSHFWEYWPKPLQFSYEKVITPDAWPKLIARAEKIAVHIELNFRSIIKAPAKGILLYSDVSTVSSGNTNNEEDFVSQETPLPSEVSSSIPRPASMKSLNQEIPSSSKDQSSLRSDTARDPQSIHRRHPFNRLTSLGPDVLSVDFHVFTWLNKNQPTAFASCSPSKSQDGIDIVDPGVEKSFSIDQESMKADLKQIDHFLNHKIGLEERLAYKDCPLRTRTQVYQLIKDDEKVFTGLKGDTTWQHEAFEYKVDILNKAELLLQFFLPSTFEGPTVGKFWGALYRLLDSTTDHRRSLHSTSPRALDISYWLTAMSRRPQPLKDILSHADSTERALIEIPEEFPRAWLHVLMSLIFASNEEYVTKFKDQSWSCISVLDDGMRKVVDILTTKSLLEYSVLKPWGLISLIIFQLLGDVTRESLDTSDTYFEYLSSIESDIEANPLDRAHQDKIACLKQEISVIIKILAQQQGIINTAKPVVKSRSQEVDVHNLGRSRPRYPGGSGPVYPHHPPLDTGRPVYYARDTTYTRADVTVASTPGIRAGQFRSCDQRDDYDRDIHQSGPPRTPGSQLDPTDPSGIEGLLVQDSQALIDRKIGEFREIRDRATELEEWNIQKIDYNKDRQEAAIYAFTIVTIIFLPLSSVASILGMNVNDVRNMEANQWVFWVVALPLTVIIITLCLIWAGELENLWLGFRNLWGERYAGGGGGGYSVLNSRARVIPPVIIRNRIYDEDDKY